MKSIYKKIITISLLLLAVAALALAVYLKQVMDYKQAVNAISIEEIDLSQVPDGTYCGEYDVGFIYAKVQVVINDGKIEKIDLLEHKHDRGAAAEVVVDKIVESFMNDGRLIYMGAGTSGRIGILDSVDSMLLAAPVFYLLVKIF